MNDELTEARVPARLVLASLIALWTCYFLVATLRWYFLGHGFEWLVVSRRLTICVVSMLVMAAMWPLLQLLDNRSFGVRVVVVLVAALPLSLGLGAINEAVFSDINQTLRQEEMQADGNVTIRHDEDGNLLVDLPPIPPAPPAPPESASEGASEAASPAPPPVPSVEVDKQSSTITIKSGDHEKEAKLAAITDTAFGRYFLVLAWAALYFALAKAEEARCAERREGEYRRAAAAAELRSLRYQVNPHFLFNTLNSLSALVMTGRQEAAEEMIQTLSTFYRHTLSGDPTSDLPLTDEIELQRLYLAIEAVRFPERLLTQIDVDADVADAMVPGMILQPLVENSVKYAVASTREPVTIAIAARREDGFLCLSVSDDGRGTRTDDTQGCGIGLGNVRDRLRVRFGEDATLQFGQRASGGFETVIRIPLEQAYPVGADL